MNRLNSSAILAHGTASSPWLVEEPVRDEYRGLIGQIRLRHSGSLAVGVCSWLPNEGASEVAAGLACAAAESSTVFLLDLAVPSVQKEIFQIDTPGILSAGLLRFNTSSATVSLLAPDAGSPMPAAAIDSFKRHDSIVLVDLPPLRSGFKDQTIIHSLDGMILVVKEDGTRREDARRAASQLQSAGPPFLGCVLTHVKEHTPNFLRRFLK